MKNKYEFNIEDINSVKIITLTDPYKYTVNYKREDNYFVESFEAEDDTSDPELIGIICPRCGQWLYYNRDGFDRNSAHCDCDEQSVTKYSEEELIEIIMSYMAEDIFYSINLIINDTLIL